jgi:formamidopyrimidine-DNA glycosylase
VPELPDVEQLRRYLDATALHQSVESVSMRCGDRLLTGISARSLKRHLRGRSLRSTLRHGKFLLVSLSDASGLLVLHFGMTGFLKYHRKPGSAPAHPRLELGFANGYRLVYDCQRLFGEIGFAREHEAWSERRGLGPDALALDTAGFAASLSGRRGSLKSALMRQSVIAGIGNVYSDEILFRARMHPRTRVTRLAERDLEHLHRSLRAVLLGAIEHRADPERVPRSWLLPHRSAGERCPRCHGELSRLVVAGRAAWLCPACQEER